MPTLSPPTRLLRSQFVDLLVGPHGIDRYLELIRPDLTVNDARAELVRVRRQTSRSVTLTLRPNAAFKGFRAGQFVGVGVEIDGVRRTRTYSPACSERDVQLELTVTVHPEGAVSRHLHEHLTLGTILYLGPAQGDFILPEPRPERLVLISGGSGVTPVMSMLRTLCDEGYGGEVEFLHYARTREDFLYQAEVEELLGRSAANGGGASYIATREGGGHVTAEALGDPTRGTAAVCGPPALIDAVNAIWQGPLISESFTPPSLSLAASEAKQNGGAAARGQLRFMNTGKTAPIGQGTLLEQAEAAGLSPDFGCRMGICHTCTCRKAAGAVQNILTGEVSHEEDEDIQLCISLPAGDVTLEI